MQLISKIIKIPSLLYNGTKLLCSVTFRYFYLMIKRKHSRINKFEAEHIFVVKNSAIKLIWSVENIYKVVISDVGTFYKDNGEIIIRADFKERKFKLIAYGFRQRKSETIKITTTPFNVNIDFKVEMVKQKRISVLNNKLIFKNKINLKENNISLIPIEYNESL
jgi:hypothetical protein